MEVLHCSYTMGTPGSSDIYTLSPQACGPRASDVYIRQTTHVHGIAIKCKSRYVCMYVCTYVCINVHSYDRICYAFLVSK